MRLLASALVVMLPTMFAVDGTQRAQGAETATSPEPSIGEDSSDPVGPSLTAVETAVSASGAAVVTPQALPPLPPPGGSQLAADGNTCAQCHGEADLWGENDQRLFVPHGDSADDVHWQKGVNCHDCHGGDPTSLNVPAAHSVEVAPGSSVLPFRSPLNTLWQACSACHAEQTLDVQKGAHAQAGPKDASGVATSITCGACHGGTAHRMLPAIDSRSPVFVDNRERTCSECHEEQVLRLHTGVHASAGPKDSNGSAAVLSCATCHGGNSHAMLPVDDRGSPAFLDNQVQTCGACHEEQTRALHGGVHAHAGDKDSSGAAVVLGCAKCHSGDAHGMLPVADSQSPVSFENQIGTCGECHTEQMEKLRVGAHANAGPKDPSGAATVLSCASCHGGKSHGMLPVSDRRSPVFLDNQDQTCGACHEEQTLELHNGVHAHAGPEDSSGAGTVLRCAQCHSGDAHGILPVDDSRSPVFFENQIGTCGECHAEQTESLRKGAHAHAGPMGSSGAAAVLSCASCHGDKSHGMLPADDRRSPVFLDNQDQTCGVCHTEQMLEVREGVHAHAGPKTAGGIASVLRCAECHGGNAHDILPASDTRSPVYLDNQVQTCGACHEEDLATYRASVHGTGLDKSGLTVVAVCADCHGDHEIHDIVDPRSTLHTDNVAKTCGECHRFVEERLEESVHGRAQVLARVPDRESNATAPQERRPATCSDCHTGHELLDPRLTPFRLDLANRCGDCHPDRSSRYGMSLHGQFTDLGHAPAAECADCHGAHDILPISDPKSLLAVGANRLATCRKCHPYAVQNFTDFDPHADYRDAANYPVLYNVARSLRLLFFAFFGFFAIHSLLWFVRSLINAIRGGRHETLTSGQFVVMRSDPFDRNLYAILLICFLGLILTALPLEFSSQPWAERLARNLGGYRTTSVWHHFFAAVATVGCGLHIVRGVRGILRQRNERVTWNRILFGPDSRLPVGRDFKDLLAMGRWFFGLGPRPGFERWTYWEKFDYWAVYLTAAVIGVSGMMLWYPNLFCTVLPGKALNVAKAVHNEVAVLAASFLFLFHFCNTHFRPEKFPMDLSALTGMVSESHLRKYRPEYVERLDREGKLDAMRFRAPSRRRLWVVFLAGSVVLSLGVLLLILVLVATLAK